VRSALLVALALSLSGCCTVLFGLAADKQVHLDSAPSGAEVWIDGKRHGERTPCSFMLTSGVDHEVVCRLEGEGGVIYRRTSRFTARLQPWRAFWDYVLPLGSVWVITDYLTGALWEFEPDRLVLDLLPDRVVDK
jgi:hypothetical protein